MREIRRVYPQDFRLIWTPTDLSGKRVIDEYLSFIYSKVDFSESYFFTFPSLFYAFNKHSNGIRNKISMVLYTHATPELGDLSKQVDLLSEADLTFFMSERDRTILVSRGLDVRKTEVLHFGFEGDLGLNSNKKVEKLVVLASNYSARKGIEKLLPVVSRLKEFKFIGLGRNWERSPIYTLLLEQDNFSFFEFNLESRNHWFSRAEIFLSLSSLEGGPVPLLEALSAGTYPVVTDTGFCRDFIGDRRQGVIMDINPTIDEIVNSIQLADKHIRSCGISKVDVSTAYWSKVAEKVFHHRQRLLGSK